MTRTEQIAVDTLLGRLTRAQAEEARAQTHCADPAEHRWHWARSERTWRLAPRQRDAELAAGCPWCGLPITHPTAPTGGDA
jgi:hypothetical protein